MSAREGRVLVVTEILWGPYQEHHITVRHGVTAEQFDEAWVFDPECVFPITAYFLAHESE